MYCKPTEEMIQEGIDAGWSREESERGYDIFEFNGTGCLMIERIDAVFLADDDYDVTDDDCAEEAQRTGFCKIIPVDELPENMIYNGADMRVPLWIDTPENRQAIRKFFCDDVKKEED